MDVLTATARALSLTPTELMTHVVNGMLPEADPLTKSEFCRAAMRRYEEYHRIPEWLDLYCRKVLNVVATQDFMTQRFGQAV
jgi:hypothetical protein